MKRRTLFLWLGLAIAALPSKGLAQDGTRSERIGGGAQTAAENEGIQRYVFAGVAVDSFNIDQWSDLANAVNEMAAEKGVGQEAIMIAWLLRHPARIQPIIGTMNPARIAAACQADSVSLSRGEWYRLYVAGRGARLP